MPKTYYHGDRAKYTWESYIVICMKVCLLFKEIGEPLTKFMKILNLKNDIRSTAMLENTIEATRTSHVINVTFQAYINFLTEVMTSKYSQNETCKYNVPRQGSEIQSYGKRRRRNRGRSR